MRCSHAMEAKRLLRSRLSALRGQRSATDRARVGEAISRHGTALWSATATVAAYAGMGTEPPTRYLLDSLRRAGVDVLLPVVAGDRLDWARYDGWEALVPGPRGFAEPAGARLGADAVGDADVVVVPALAVDLAGYRLGRGAGYYDRTLATVETARAVAVVYDDEVLDHLPVEAHDRPVAAALTTAGLRVLGPGGQ